MADSDPIALFTHVFQAFSSLGLAYLHLVEPGIAGPPVTHPHQSAA
ncbi:hypothetical protein ACIPW9_35990 [Streptomyces sp. NPDC090052]